jgi:lipid-A-disaccharide synthase-like uncharacterized protein
MNVLLDGWRSAVMATSDGLVDPWIFFGLGAQGVFFLRFLVQWLASEREGRSVIPEAFWWLSIAGAVGLLIYAGIHLRDPVITIGQATGLFIYARNLWLIRRRSHPAVAQPSSGS